MVGLEPEEVDLEVGRGLYVGEDEVVEVHRLLVAPDRKGTVRRHDGR